MYKPVFLPRALEDVNAIARYISVDLEAPWAARRLQKALAEAVADLTKNPLRHRLYRSHRALHLEYRAVRVKNYSVFYVVQEDVVEIHRILYSRSNMDASLQDDEKLSRQGAGGE
jgi:plasmid stabilization system protein ParE